MWWHIPAPFEKRALLPKHAVQTTVEESDGRYTVASVRNFVFGPGGAELTEWKPHVQIDTNTITRTWLLLEPFSGQKFVAHPYFLFETKSGFVCFSIEGRRPAGAPYSALTGFLNGYQLGFVWVTIHDLITMPFSAEAQALWLYPLSFSETESRALAKIFLKKTNESAHRPQYYNTIFQNCTTIFRDSLREAGIPAPSSIAWYAPGYLDELFIRLGYIKSTVSVQRLRAQSDLLAERERLWPLRTHSAAEFSNAIIAALHHRINT